MILNYDNLLTRELASRSRGKCYFFSRKEALNEGFYIENGNFTIAINGKKDVVCSVSDMFIFGDHNVENALASIALAFLSGIEIEAIKRALMTFKGVEHRIEYVDNLKNRKFYNDSKGTNVDSTVCALRSMKTPTVLIAGGMDKGSTYEEMFEAFDGKVKSLVLLGETKEKILEEARRQGYEPCYLVKNMEEAVQKAYEMSNEGDAILLSPACASWDMYANFEKRGEHFKNCVEALKGSL